MNIVTSSRDSKAMRILPLVALLLILMASQAQAQLIRLRSAGFDPLAAGVTLQGADDTLPAAAPPAADERAVVLIQWSQSPDEGALAAVRALGAELIQPVPDFGWLIALPAGATVESFTRSQALTLAGEARWASAMQPVWKLDPDVRVALTKGARPLPFTILADESQALPSKLHNFMVQIVRTGGEPSIFEELERRGATRAPLGSIDLVDIWRVSADAATAQWLATRNSVIWIEPAVEPKLHGEREALSAAGRMKPDRTDVSVGGGGTYQQWLQSVGLSGKDLLVHVADDGLSKGNSSNAAGTAHPDIIGRILYIQNLTSDITGDSPGGHGHLNASIIMGQPIAGGGRLDKDGYYLGQGVAPQARIYATKIFDAAGRFDIGSRGVRDLYTGANAFGARVSSNSWGSDDRGNYSSLSQIFDAMTRDVDLIKSGFQPMLFVVSAGNDGPSSSTIGSPGTAKNVITVGASENSDRGVLDRSGMGPTDSNDMRDMADFSSRGPTRDGRMSPTMTAVGVHVPGAASDSSRYDGTGVSGRAQSSLLPGEPASATRYYPPFQSDYTWSSGTSHSTPIVAGAALLFYEYYQKRYGVPPSPALIKAALVAATIDPVGGRRNDGTNGLLGFIPNIHAGWGFINLEGLVDGSVAQLSHNQDVILSPSRRSFSQRVQVTSSRHPLRVALAWTDPIGFVGSQQALINDLDLTVTDGTSTWFGNVFSNGVSVTGGGADDVNNLECVFLNNPLPAVYTITVSVGTLGADALPGQGSGLEQDFGLFVLNAAEQSPIGQVDVDRTLYRCMDTITIAVSDSDLKNAGTTTVTVTASGTGDSEQVTLTEIEADSGILRGTITTAAGNATAGNGTLEVGPSDTIRVTYQDATLGGNGQPLVATIESAVDCAPPVILELEVDELTDERARIHVVTDEPAEIRILIGSTPGVVDQTVTNDSIASDQFLEITGLSPCSPAFYRVMVIDAAGNETTTGGEDGYYALQTLGHGTRFYDDMEMTEMSEWQTSAEVGTSEWITSDTTYAHSPVLAWFTPNPATVTDSRLITPSFSLPADRQARVAFWHTFEFEAAGVTAAFDGGVIEISTNEGASWQDLGPHILVGGYNSRIATGFGNPLAGRQAWGGGSLAAPTRVLIDLSDFDGTTAMIRFRMGCDEDTAGVGWIIDDMSVYSLESCVSDLAQINLNTSSFNCSGGTLDFVLSDNGLFDGGPSGMGPEDFYLEANGQRVYYLPEELQAISGQEVWSGSISMQPLPDGRIRAGGLLDLSEGDTLRIYYYDSDALGAFIRVFDEAVVDCTKPSLLSFRRTQLRDTSALYEFETSEPVTFTVNYGTAPEALTSTLKSTTLGNTLKLDFTGLTVCTAYYFTVTVTDEAGNSTVFDNIGELYGFKTMQQSTQTDDLEPEPGTGWTHGAMIGSDDWTATFAPGSWSSGYSGFARSPSHAWQVASTTSRKDAWLATPPLSVTPGMRLSFWHTWQFEAGTNTFDGAVLEISLDGGTSWSDIGQNITSGGYNGFLATDTGNPLAGRPAWVAGAIGTMKRVNVDLSGYVGEGRLIRFRHVCDDSIRGEGWIIDDISTTRFVPCGEQFPTPPVLTGPAPGQPNVPFDGTASLTWNAIAGAERYQVFLGRSADLLSFYDESTDPSLSPALGDLKAGLTYFWQVRAINALGAGELGPVQSFRVRPVDPARVANQVVGTSPGLDEAEMQAADYNNDGAIKVTDLVTAINNQ